MCREAGAATARAQARIAPRRADRNGSSIPIGIFSFEDLIPTAPAMNRIVSRTVCLAAVLVSQVSNANACSCVSLLGHEPVEVQVGHALAGAHAVFAAEVVDVRSEKAGVADTVQRARLRVIQSWKGPHQPGSTVRTRTPGNAGLCGFLVGNGQQLLLYVVGTEPYGLTVCSRTKRLDAAVADVQVLEMLAAGKKK